MSKKKLAIFVNSLARAGAEKVVFLLTKELRTDFDIHLLVFNSDIINFDVPADIKIVQIGRPDNNGRFAGLFKVVSLARQVKQYLTEQQIPVIMSFLSRPNFTTGVVKMLGWKGHAIISERTMTSAYYDQGTLSGKIGRFLVRRLYRKVDLIITNAKLNESDLAKTFSLPNKIITIYNPIDLKEAESAQKEHATDLIKEPGDFLFCNVGRYDYYKNHQLLLHAFAKVTNPKAKLVIIGKDVPEKLGPLRTKLKLENKVQLIDIKQNVFPYLLSVNAFVLSSVIEGFPNVLLEALACSLPIISTDCKSGPREILAPGTDYPSQMTHFEAAQFGLLVKNNDADMLAAAMQKMSEDTAMCQHYAAKAFTRAQDFDINLIVKEFREAVNQFYGATGTGAI